MAEETGRLLDALEDGVSVRNIAFGDDVVLESTKTGDDKGLAVKGGQFSVGSPTDPQESVFGSGDSYPVPIAFHFDYANLSGTTITSATDVTNIFQSDSDSATGLFNGVVSGRCLLVGATTNYGGFKIKYDDTGSVDSSNVVIEYLQDDTPTWVSAPWMVTTSAQTYLSSSHHSNNIGGSGGSSEQVRVGFDPDNIPTTWATVDMTINGTVYSYKWALIRLTGSISTDPTVQQIKLHTNRFEINGDGDREYFGLSRPPFAISTTINDWVDTSAAPSDEDISYSTNITIERTGNEFVGSAADSLGAAFKLPQWIDTSLPVIVNVFWYANTAGAGDVELSLYNALISIGDNLDGTATDAVLTDVTSVDTEQYLLRKTSFKLWIPTASSSDTLALKLERDATAGNTDDTYADSIIVENIGVLAYRWK